MKCPVCQENEAVIDQFYGVLPCGNCQARRESLPLPKTYIEFTKEEIKSQRNEYFKSLLKAYRDGIPSKEFAETYPEIAAQTFSEKDKKNLKEVYNDIAPLNWKRSK